MTEILKRAGRPDLAYEYDKGKSAFPTVMFLGGFRSDMMGSKASFLSEQCHLRGQSFIRFDYSGHGQSGGAFEEGCISIWKQDAIDVLNHCSPQSVILIGSSMGGWISLLIAQAMSKHVHALIGIASAPDFTMWMEEKMNTHQRENLHINEFFELPSDYGTPYIITQNLIEDGRKNFLLDKPIYIDVPVRLLQGKQDGDVPWQTAERIKQSLTSRDVKIYYQENGNHSLSSPEDLALLDDVIQKLNVL